MVKIKLFDDYLYRELDSIMEEILPPLYYALDSNLSLGKVYKIKKNDFHEEFIICNPKDFPTIKGDFKGRKLLPITEMPYNYMGMLKEITF